MEVRVFSAAPSQFFQRKVRERNPSLATSPVALPRIGLEILSIDPQSGSILCQRSRKITEDVTDTGYIGIFLTPQNSTTTGVEVVSRSRVPLYLLGSHANDLIGHSLESQIIMTLQRP
jgi:hypothetical protein